MKQITVGIVGYGNLGRAAELAIRAVDDLVLAAVFSRRQLAHPLYQPMGEVGKWQDKLDVLLLCGGSATDLPIQTPELAKSFHVVDSFDTHARIPEHFGKVDAAAREAGKLALISTGWDPGLFSLARVLFEAILPQGTSYTFWGQGVSQGHSDALRRLPGVANAIQYTVPSDDALRRVREGESPELTARERHTRRCFVVLAEGADASAVKSAIVNMPHYFADYDTTVEFISPEEMARDHAAQPHGGSVLRSGQTGEDHQHLMEFSIRLASNPEFTASVLVACARAVYRLSKQGEQGARTIFDIPLGLLSPVSAEHLRRDCL